jgi:hypothetical protein
MSNNQEDLKTTLLDAGWYDGRSIRKNIANTLLYKIFPAKIQDFLSEFGDLKIHAENKIETMTIDTSHMDSKKVFDYHHFNVYKIGDKIDLSEDKSLVYYYSTLIGTQLYPVAELIEQCTVMMDENGNFYIINFLPELISVSNSTSDALTKIIFGSRGMAILNEDTLEWMPPIGKELEYTLPINPNLKINPW